MTRTILIRTDGRIEYVDHDGDGIPGKRTTRRASHVWPCGFWRRMAFRLIRACCSDESRLAAWTRTWRGPWMVKIIGGPEGGPFEERKVALRWEVCWLRTNRR